MSSSKVARSKLADVLADIKSRAAEDDHEVAPTPAKRRMAVNYVALSGRTTRQTRGNNANSNNISNHNLESKTKPRTKTCILKLFDRTVDLAQFSDETPLYPICRAWVVGHRPSKQCTSVTASPECSEAEVHCLPPPKPKASDEDMDVRIPQSVRDFKAPENSEENIDKSISSMEHQECLELNKRRWRKVKSDWSEARKIHEIRYADSFRILNDMFLASSS